jgi:uncharacterized protein GlcG (DUF336 family)
VLDAGGQVRAFEREDGASNARFEIAFGNAHGALALGMGPRALMERAEQQPIFIDAVAGAIGGALVPAPGGVLVRSADGELVGALGVTGDSSDNDEAAAVDAIRAVGLEPVTGRTRQAAQAFATAVADRDCDRSPDPSGHHRIRFKPDCDRLTKLASI